MEPYMDCVPYTNERLAAAARNPAFLTIKSPRDPYVLNAMRKVDRREFLENTPMEFSAINLEAFERMESTYRQINVLGKMKLVHPNFDKEMMRLTERLLAATLDLAAGGIGTYVLSPASLAYNDCTIPIPCDQRCSKSSLVAFMNDILDIREGQNILEIGSGCGYHAAVTLEQLGESGKLTTIEIQSKLAEFGRRNLARYGSKVEVVNCDGKTGYDKNAPYDRVYITAGVKIDEFDPTVFLAQLKKDDGVFLFPEPHGFHLMGYHEGEYWENQHNMTLSFVPLV